MKLYIRLAIFFTAPFCYCQNPGNVSGQTLWLEPSMFNDSTFVRTTDLSVLNVRHFNFNPVLGPKKHEKDFYKNLLRDRYSFFIVFKSDSETKQQIATLKRGKYNVDINSQGITGNTEMAYDEITAEKGMLLGFVSSNHAQGKKNNIITIGDFYHDNEGGKQQLMEVLYYPRILKPVERRKVETYLSLKYGISITGNADYVNSSGDTIWHQKNSQDFKNRITGIGRDDLLHLSQRQSGNAQKDGLYIGLGSIDTTNAHNRYKIKDKSFMLWGDNGKAVELKNRGDNATKRMERVWKMCVSGVIAGDSIMTQVRISKAEMNLNDDGNSVYLAVNDIAAARFDYIDAHYIRQSREDDEFVYFDSVIWDANGDGSDSFTIIKGPEYFVEYETIVDCGRELPGTITLHINGGTLPFSFTLNNQEVKAQMNTEGNYTLNNIAEGRHMVAVRDVAGNTVTVTPIIDFFATEGVNLAPVWQLDKTGQVRILPTALNPEGLTYEWSGQDGNTVSGSEFTAVKAGTYILEVTNSKGCKKMIPFEVEPANSGWSLYPNPIISGREFNIAFDLDKESDVAIRISTLEGKLFLEKSLGRLQYDTFSAPLITSGVYMVTVIVNGYEETTSLVVK